MASPSHIPVNGRGIELRGFSVKTAGGADLVRCEALEVAPGRLHVILGPNGSGKTSLLRGMTGILPSRGQLTVDGVNLGDAGLSKRTKVLAYQPQGSVSGDGITAREFVLAGCTANAGWLGGATKEQVQRADRALAATGSAALALRMLDSLSGGETARVALASTLASGTHWMLLDEPVAAADIAAAREIYRMLRRMVDDGRASMVVVEHDLGIARSFADDITIIDSGKVVFTGSVADAFADPALERAYGCKLAAVQVGQDAWAVAAVGEAGSPQSSAQSTSQSPAPTRPKATLSGGRA